MTNQTTITTGTSAGGNGPAPIDVILSGTLMVLLLIFGVVLVRKPGVLKGVGIFLLLILVANIFNNSAYWITYVSNANQWITNFNAKIGANKHVQGS